MKRSGFSPDTSFPSRPQMDARWSAANHTMEPSQKLSYTVDEAAAAIGIGRTKLYELIGEHALPTFKIGARTLIRRDALVDLIDRLSSARAA